MTPGPSPNRWTRLSPGSDDEARAGALLRAAIRRRPISPGAVDEIRRRLEPAPASPRRPWAWQLAIGLALVLGGGTLVAAATRIFSRLEPPAAPAPAPILDDPPLRKPHRHRAPIPAPPELAAVIGPDEASAVSRPPIHPARRRPPAPAAASPAPSTLAQESRLLAEALHALRQENDPAGALRRLDQHASRFGGSATLMLEARMARLEALLRLGRQEEGLALLDGLVLSAAGTGREPLVARGELRARAGRCREALEDFELLLAGDPPADGVTERALVGRAACRARKGDSAGAREDLTRDLAQFPSGPRAAAARSALGR